MAGHELSAGRGVALMLLLLLMVVGMVAAFKSGGLIMDYLQAEVGV